MCYPSPRLSILTVPSWQFPLHMWHCGLSAARSQHPRKVTLLPFSLPSVLAVPALWRLRAKTFLVIFLGDNKEYCLLSVTVLLPAVPQLLVHMHEKTAALITALTPFVHTDPSLWAWYRHTKSCWCQRMAPNALQPCPPNPNTRGHHSAPSWVPCACIRFPPAVLHMAVYVCQSYSQFIPPSPSHTASTSLLSTFAGEVFLYHRLWLNYILIFMTELMTSFKLEANVDW